MLLSDKDFNNDDVENVIVIISTGKQCFFELMRQDC